MKTYFSMKCRRISPHFELKKTKESLVQHHLFFTGITSICKLTADISVILINHNLEYILVQVQLLNVLDILP